MRFDKYEYDLLNKLARLSGRTKQEIAQLAIRMLASATHGRSDAEAAEALRSMIEKDLFVKEVLAEATSQGVKTSYEEAERSVNFLIERETAGRRQEADQPPPQLRRRRPNPRPRKGRLTHNPFADLAKKVSDD